MYTSEKKGKNNIPTIVIFDLNAKLEKIDASSWPSPMKIPAPRLPEVEFKDIKHLKFKMKQTYRVFGSQKVDDILFEGLGELKIKTLNFV